MRITDVEGIILRLPEVKLIGDNCQTVLIVRVHTDEGVVGLGEVHTNPLVSRAIIDAPVGSSSSSGLREILVGQDPRNVNLLMDLMARRTIAFGRRGAAVHAISGIEIALWDILGQVTGVPVWQLLGGARRTRVPAYASFLAPASPDEAADLASEHVALGYRAVKLGWGDLGGDPRADARLVAAVRDRVGPDVDIMLDLGFPIPLSKALYLGDALAESGVYFMEEPLAADDIAGYARLTAASRTPIATGEKETTQYPFIDLMDRGGLRIIQPDVARVGGIAETLRIASHAAVRGVTVIPHCWATDILVAATLHVLAVLPDAPYLELNVTPNPLRTSLGAVPITARDGIVDVPSGAGLGVVLNEETLNAYRWEP